MWHCYWGPGNVTDGITLQYSYVALLLVTGNVFDGITVEHCNVALLYVGGECM